MIWNDLDRRLEPVPGTISVYVARLGEPPTYTRLADTTHYAASTMKVAVLVALHRAAETGRLDLDTPVPVRNSFASAQPGAPRFTCAQDYDNDDEVWARVGGTAALRWLAHRMIVRSSNLATNLVIAHVGLPAVAEVWSLVDAHGSVTARGIEDFAARDAGITNLVTAAGQSALLDALARGADTPGPLATPQTCQTMLDVLFAQEHHEDLASGLPTGTRIAHKNGWVTGVRHGTGVVFPDDAPPYVIAVCTTTDLADGSDDEKDAACRLIADISAHVWHHRHGLGA